MSEFEVLIPKLGESIQEATITKIFVKVGDIIAEDDLLFEVATDKVDSEIPSPVSGSIKAIHCKIDDLLAVGKVAMVIDLEGKSVEPVTSEINSPEIEIISPKVIPSSVTVDSVKGSTTKFFSPLVKRIAKKEGIRLEELENLEGSGIGGRIQKNDLVKYIEDGVLRQIDSTSQIESIVTNSSEAEANQKQSVSLSIGAEDTIFAMDRIRKLIAKHMVMSKQTAPHVTSFVEADATEMVLWRNRFKDDFSSKY